ncbi:thioredoxin domain-containing protein [Yersinia mollaretii]|uniref:Thiol:disulfide interchange protein n=1 Tax=Yersinia mollaretii TaxID=33060 RepID=A0AA44HZ92_YERMO|nr:DsbA family protein [Yersinia mollaretii]NIL22483.1 thioredoxin domain-containing protein [Yersinia mollaretii]CNI73063.1 protein disulfide isomerase I [Yersinia mollaretii]CNK62949.1 protein disulfide isomerase I [Yersinia enterocolitica]CQQ70831.1 protein disulfide isomerase I [Yersinia mollaretii]
MSKKIYLGFIALLLMFSLPASYAVDYKEGISYTSLEKPVASAPAVVEFFSFYCGPCYMFTSTYNVSKSVSEGLPAGTKLVKYHVSLMGKLGNELTEAWSVAMVLGIEDKIEASMFEKLQRENAINGIDDIKKVFAEAGVSESVYDNIRQSPSVKTLVAKQNEAVKEMDIRGTPSFYVLGKYKIENSGIADKSIEGYAKEYASVIRFLLDKQP